MKKVKLKLFPESSAIDSLLAKRQLAISGFQYSELESPILYRGDERGPDIIFKEGFFRKPEKNTIPLPNITSEGESKNCIAITKDLVHAVGFADNPSTTLGFFNEPKKEFGWVYILYTDKGIDLTLNKDAFSLAHHVKEVVVTGVPPEHIIAAFQIKTTNNGIYPYIKWYAGRIDAGLESPVFNRDVSWQIICTKFEKNPNFSKDIDILPYQKNIDDFLQVAEKGYFRIPWSPFKEEVDFHITHNMSDTQKNVYRMMPGLTVEQIKNLKYSQLKGLELGFSADYVKSEWFSMRHLNALEKGVPLNYLIGISSEKAQSLEKNLKNPFYQACYFFKRSFSKDNTHSNPVEIPRPKV